MKLSSFISFFSFLNPRNIKHWFNVEYLFVNYFWFLSISALSVLIIHRDTMFNIGFPILLYAMTVKNLRLKSINIIDCLWIVDFLWIVFTWLMNDYPHKGYLIFRAFCQELAYMIAYWIVRGSKKNYVQIIIEKARKPLIIACIIGIYCFFFEPSWYQTMVNRTIITFHGTDSFSKESMLEQYRLRSIYNGPYVLAYFCAIVLIYEIFIYLKLGRNVFPSKTSKSFVSYVFLLGCTCLLCMMRAPIACVIISFFLMYFCSILYVGDLRKTIKIFGIVLGLCIIVFIFIKHIDTSILSFMFNKIEKITDINENFFLERLFLQAKSFSLTGDGYGRYSTIALYKFGMYSIPDGEYMKIISEQGYVGFIIMMSMFGLGLIKAIIYNKKLFFELCMLIMLFICMVGADPLSIYDKHCFLFWMILGQISRYKKNKHEDKSDSNVFTPVSPDTRK